MDRLENSLRVKVTGKCNRNCFFCHQEGGMERIDRICFSTSFKMFVDRMYRDFNICHMALTGGEPLLHPKLLEFMRSVRRETSIKGFSLTTNGTIYKDTSFWEEMVNLGLYKVNLSISDILEAIPAVNAPNELSIFANQKRIINLLNQYGIRPNINVVVYNDQKYLINLLNELFGLECCFDVALLPDLTNGSTFAYSQKVIHDVLESLHCVKKKRKNRKGTSNTVFEYVTDKGVDLQVKTTKIDGTPKWLHSICDSCLKRDECQEGFYGVRIESISGEIMVRLCLYKSDTEVLMPVDTFFESEVYAELMEIWEN